MRGDGTRVQRWRVLPGFLVTPLFLLLAATNARTLAAGGALALLGLLIRAWASGHIRKNDALATSGPYAYTRNPLYLGSFVMGLGFTVAASGRWWQLAVLGAAFAAPFLAIYVPAMRVEAQTLAGKFGGEFDAYARAVPLFLPRLTAYRGANETGFDARLYLRYREYRAALGLTAAFALLLLKWLLLK